MNMNNKLNYCLHKGEDFVLKSILNEVKSILNEVKSILNEVKSILNEVKSILNEVKSILNEVKSAKFYSFIADEATAYTTNIL